MSRKVVRLTLDRLEVLSASTRGPRCASCTFWELDPVRRRRVDDDAAGAAEKDAWLSTVLREWGSCGRVVEVDEVPVGWIVYAPAAFVPGAASFPTAPVSPDAVLLTTAHVEPAHAGGGLGRMLVQGMARDLIERGGVRAVEAFGRVDPGPPGGCVLPADFLTSVGFKTQRAHRSVPRLRMELRSALTWRDEVEAALERLLGVVRPRPAPAPQTQRQAQRQTQRQAQQPTRET